MKRILDRDRYAEMRSYGHGKFIAFSAALNFWWMCAIGWTLGAIVGVMLPELFR